MLVSLSSAGRQIRMGTMTNWKKARTMAPMSTFFHIPRSLLLAPRFTSRKTKASVEMAKGRMDRALAKS